MGLPLALGQAFPARRAVMGEVGSMRSMRPNQRRLSSVGRITPDAGFVAMEQFGQQVAVVRSMRPNQRRLSSVGRITPDAGFVAMEQFGQQVAVVNVGRRRRKGMNDLQPAVNTDVRFHPEVPLIALHGLVHLGIALTFGVFRRAWRRDDGRIDDRAAANL